MTPQLFINYKLKSVAHLPWRMLTYKALNTFIDDIFAFVIKMPTLYRIGCLRDGELTTVLPAKSDSDVMFCLQSYQGLRIDRSLVYQSYPQDRINTQMIYQFALAQVECTS